jgi:hypothetical protein
VFAKHRRDLDKAIEMVAEARLAEFDN